VFVFVFHRPSFRNRAYTNLLSDKESTSVLFCFPVGLQHNRDQDVIDNEGMGRKSSKRCCIFHKPRPFGESSTDSSDYDSDNGKNNDNDNNDNKKIAHKKNPGTKKTPDHLRFHA
jgi:hypothetical protein